MKCKLLLLLLFGPLCLFAQDIEVKKFEPLEKDQTAALSPRKDINGVTCGLVKVLLKEPGAEFEGNVMGDVQFTGNEYLVYLPNGTKRLGIKHPDYLPTTIVFADYGTKRIASSTTYELKVKTNKKQAKVDNSKKGMAVFNIKPSNTMLLIDGQIADGSGGAYTLSLPYGTHYYTVKLKDFSINNQSVQIDKNAKNINVDLTEFFAKVNVSCNTGDASISVNNEQKGFGKWSGIIIPGKCSVEVKKEGHHTLSKSFELMDGDSVNVDFAALKAITGSLCVENELENCEVFLNGEKVGTTPWVNKDLPIGEYEVEIRHENYKPLKRTLSINEDQEIRIRERLDPTQFGRLLLRAKQGNTLAIRLLADLYGLGVDGIANWDETKEESKKYANSWIDDCIEDETWSIKIEDLINEGIAIKKDICQEIYWTKKILSDNYDFCVRSWLDSQSYYLMECYLTGSGVKQDFTQSLFWAKIAAEKNWWHSNAWVAWHYYYGRGTNRDVNAAIRWLSKENDKYKACNSTILREAIIGPSAEYMDKKIIELFNKD